MRSVRTALTSNLREAVRSLLGAWLRTLLGLIGIMIGIASVITMISMGEIAKFQSRQEFEALGTDILAIRRTNHQANTTGRASVGLEDALLLAEVLPSVSEAAPRIRAQGPFRFAGKGVGNGSVQGISASFANLNRLRVAEGRFVSDLDRGRYFTVVGADVAEAMRRLGAGSVVGEFLEVGERLYTVVGVLESATESYALPFSVDANQSIFVPITTVRRTEPEKEIELIVARAAPGMHYSDAARDVQTYFAKRSRGIELEVVSAEQLIEQMEAQLGLMTLLLGAVGSVSLIVGGIGVMN
ncbi:MAG: ABC transporter permease, partial [bacterium]|nr:ABC transporter permease [bacterium]